MLASITVHSALASCNTWSGEAWGMAWWAASACIHVSWDPVDIEPCT